MPRKSRTSAIHNAVQAAAGIPQRNPNPLGSADMTYLSPLPAFNAPSSVAQSGSPADSSPVSTKYILAEHIGHSRWNTRHASSFTDEEFQSLKADIALAGGNIQPVKVRRRNDASGPGASGRVETYELIFGHRRHQACLQLGLPVLAILEDVSDQQLIVEMLSENDNRKALTAWELGDLFRLLLDAGVFPSQTALAQALKRDEGDVSRALRVRAIPEEILAAITTPTGFALHDGDKLSKALKEDRARVMQIAQNLVASGRKVPAKEFMRLIAKKPEPKAKCACEEIGGSKIEEVLLADGGRNIAVSQRHDDGTLTIRIQEALPAEIQTLIENVVASLVGAMVTE